MDDTFGGSVPKQYMPAIEKGVRQVLTTGAIAGYPLTGVRVSVYDGKHHPVDSKEVAFVTAARKAFKDAVSKARPKLLEPYVMVEVTAPAKYMGDITGHLSSKRGRILGMDQLGDMQVVKAQIPAAEIQNYSAELKAITGGEGFYHMEFSHYDMVPPNIAAPVIHAAKSRQTQGTEM